MELGSLQHRLPSLLENIGEFTDRIMLTEETKTSSWCCIVFAWLVAPACSPGNPLQETRLRALRNLLFKTNHGLVPIECLVHERAFLVALLEWFNFPDVSHEAQVLGLLARLAKVGWGYPH